MSAPIKHGGDETPFLSEINMVPFIDVCLVLLIIFMVITPYMVLNSIRVQLPKSSSEKKPPTRSLVVAIKPGRGDAYFLFINNNSVAPEDLASSVEDMVEEKKYESAVLYADREIPISVVVDAIDRIEAGGLSKISITTERKDAGKPAE